MERDCRSCIYANWRSEYDNGCSKWDCEYVNKKEVAKVLVYCKDCKHYQMHDGRALACHNLYGAVIFTEPTDFCSRGERK